ncbi:MAG: response regulator [Rhodoferax sp.]|nr:response regulator [Rhodoferax sp.]
MNKHVLVVDDSASVRCVIRHLLEDRGYTVSEAGDGQEALRYLDGRAVQMIVCDVHMPKMNGIEFVRTMRQSPAHRAVPTLMLTAEPASRAPELGLASEAKSWMVKPFAPSALLKTVDLLSGGPAFEAAP